MDPQAPPDIPPDAPWPALVLQATDDAVVFAGPDGRVLYVNPGFTRLFGYSLEALRGRLTMDFLAGPHTDRSALARARDLDSPGDYRLELLVYTRAGRPLWVSIVANVVRDADGAVLHWVAVLSDITLTKMRAVLQRRVLDAMVHETPLAEAMALVCDEVERIAPEVLCAVLAVDRQGLLHPLASHSLPDSLAELLDGRAADALASAEGLAQGPDGLGLLWRISQRLVAPLGVQACGCWSIRGSDGGLLGMLLLYFRAPRASDGFPRPLIDICVQLCALALERSRAHEKMEELASFDALTGLANRMALKARASQVVQELEQAAVPDSMAILCIDVDRFKRVNEAHGSIVGDAVLRELAARLMRAVRGIDLTGRLDGDGFAAILPNCKLQQAVVAAGRVQAAIGAPLPLTQGGAALHLTAGVGVAMYPDDGIGIDELLHHADMALAQAKAGGARGGLRFFNDEMQRRVRESVALEAALRDQLRVGGLRLHYQPQIDRQAGRLYGVEALARWTHATLGEIPPSRFIRLAEETGLAEQLGRWALAEACRQMAAWRQAGVAVPRVGVNLSARDFENPQLVPHVAALLECHGLVAADLTLEMTESVMLDASTEVMATLAALRGMGVHLSLDDFGTGYSSLSYLHRLPIHELKLDQSFVRDLAESSGARALTNTILRIGESLGLTVVAEGVETVAQAALLAERGNTIVQGYLYGAPMPAAELPRWLDAPRNWHLPGGQAADQGAGVLGS